jgi:peptide chain release factor 2
MDTVELIEMAEAEGDEGLVDDAVKALAELAERAERDKVAACSPARPTPTTPISRSMPAPAAPRARTGPRCSSACTRAGPSGHRYKVELVDHHAGEQAGIKSATLLVKGENAYGYAKTESGVHRLVRISPYDSNARRHTSFSSVWVYPVVDENIDIEIVESELRIDTYRASGAGGQHINTTDSAVRITHLPTGHRRPCQNQRSQHKNRAEAMKQLKAKLYEAELQKREAEAKRPQRPRPTSAGATRSAPTCSSPISW